MTKILMIIHRAKFSILLLECGHWMRFANQVTPPIKGQEITCTECAKRDHD